MESNSNRSINVGDIDNEERRSLEQLLGQKLQDNQQVYIIAFTPGIVPDDETRRRAVTNLRKIFAKTEQYAKEHGITDEAIDGAVDEAVENVRYGTVT